MALARIYLTFSYDGTFFRSGDMHPVLSAGHVALEARWANQYNASYVAFSFDDSVAVSLTRLFS